MIKTFLRTLCLAPLLLPGADVTVVRTIQKPEIDGILDDRAHFAATAAKSLCAGFFSRAYSKIADYQPLVLLSYDSENLYLGYHSPIAPIKPPSKEFSWYDDLVQIIIGEHSFAISASGACDPLNLAGAAKIQENRWSAELVIPWKQTGFRAPAPGTELPFRLLTYQTGTRDWQIYLPLIQSPKRPGTMAFGTEFPVAYRPRNSAEDQF